MEAKESSRESGDDSWLHIYGMSRAGGTFEDREHFNLRDGAIERERCHAGLGPEEYVEVIVVCGGSVVKNPPANAEDKGSFHQSERSPREGNSNPL